MTSERLIGGTGIIFLAAILVGLYISHRPEISLTAEQFSVQVAEANRQADVMSQLRASEESDLAVLIDGRLLSVADNHEGKRVSFREPCLHGILLPKEITPALAKDIVRVVKKSSPKEYAEVASLYIGCKRTS